MTPRKSLRPSRPRLEKRKGSEIYAGIALSPDNVREIYVGGETMTGLDTVQLGLCVKDAIRLRDWLDKALTYFEAHGRVIPKRKGGAR